MGGISEQGTHIVCTETSINQIDGDLKPSVLVEHNFSKIICKLLSFSFDGKFFIVTNNRGALVFDLESNAVSAEFNPAVITLVFRFFLTLPLLFGSPALLSSVIPPYISKIPFGSSFRSFPLLCSCTVNLIFFLSSFHSLLYCFGHRHPALFRQ